MLPVQLSSAEPTPGRRHKFAHLTLALVAVLAFFATIIAISASAIGSGNPGASLGAPPAEPVPPAPTQQSSDATGGLEQTDVPQPFDAEGNPLGTTPESPTMQRSRSVTPLPDPIPKSQATRAQEIVAPEGLRLDPTWETYDWNDADVTDRGWSASYKYSFRVEVPPLGADNQPLPDVLGEFAVIYVGDESDVRDAMVVNPDDDPFIDVSMIEVNGQPAVLTVPAESESGGVVRIDMAVNGELISGYATQTVYDGVAYGPTEEQFINIFGQYLTALYEEA